MWLLLNIIVVGNITAPSNNVYILIPRTYDYVTLHGKRNFEDVIKSRIRGWEYFPRLPGWAQCNCKIPFSERGTLECQCQTDVMWERSYQPFLGLGMKRDYKQRRIRHAGGLQKVEKARRRIFLEPPGGAQNLHFIHVRPIVDFWPRNCEIINLGYFKSPNLWLSVTAAVGN